MIILFENIGINLKRIDMLDSLTQDIPTKELRHIVDMIFDATYRFESSRLARFNGNIIHNHLTAKYAIDNYWLVELGNRSYPSLEGLSMRSHIGSYMLAHYGASQAMHIDVSYSQNLGLGFRATFRIDDYDIQGLNIATGYNYVMFDITQAHTDYFFAYASIDTNGFDW